MHHLDIVLFTVLAFAYGLVSKRLNGTALTLPILALVMGFVVGPFGFDVSHLALEHGEEGYEVVRLLAEFTLALVLFNDASGIDVRRLRTHLQLPARLLSLGLVMTVILGFLIGIPVFGDELGLWEIALLAALLAPTDAALGQAVVTQESVPQDERTALNVESGLNDGIAVPLVAALMVCSVGNSEGASGDYGWIVYAVKAIAFGVLAGIAFGWIASKLLDFAHSRGCMEEGAGRVAVAAVPVGAFFATESIGGSGFLAAFIAGLTVGACLRTLPRSTFDFTENTTEMLSILTWTIFGITAAPAALEHLTPRTITYAVLSLTVIRMLPVALALRGTGLSWPAKLFLGWFGPRGLASVVFAVAVLTEEGLAGKEQIFGVAVWTVILSVLLHGMSAGWLARRYGRYAASSS